MDMGIASVIPGNGLGRKGDAESVVRVDVGFPLLFGLKGRRGGSQDHEEYCREKCFHRLPGYFISPGKAKTKPKDNTKSKTRKPETRRERRKNRRENLRKSGVVRRARMSRGPHDGPGALAFLNLCFSLRFFLRFFLRFLRVSGFLVLVLRLFLVN